MRGALTAHRCSRAAPAHDPTPRAHRHRHEYVCAQQIQSLIMSNGRPPDPHNQTRLPTSKPNDRLYSPLWHLAGKDGIVLKIIKVKTADFSLTFVIQYIVSVTGRVQARSSLAGVRALQSTALPPPRGATSRSPAQRRSHFTQSKTDIQHAYNTPNFIQNL